MRSQPSREEEITQALLEIVDSLQGKKGLESALVYTHQDRPGGFSLILGWNTTSAPTQGSDTAIMILEGLKPLGLIDHTITIGKR